MRQLGGYSGAAYSTDVKDALGAIGHQLRQREWSVREIGEMYLDSAVLSRVKKLGG
jgi:hypothetical protein